MHYGQSCHKSHQQLFHQQFSGTIPSPQIEVTIQPHNFSHYTHHAISTHNTS